MIAGLVLAVEGVGAQWPAESGSPTATVVIADRLQLTGAVDSNSPVAHDLVDGRITTVVMTSFAGHRSDYIIRFAK